MRKPFSLKGVYPSPDDYRDYPIRAIVKQVTVIPEEVRLDNKVMKILDQGFCGTCHDDVTEVLTSKGWMLFKDLNGSEKLSSVNPETAKMVYVKPNKIFKIPYAGKMLLAETNRLNFCVTPDHTMLVRKWDNKTQTLKDEYEQVKAKDLGWYCGFMGTIKHSGHHQETYIINNEAGYLEVPMDLWLQFLGFFIAEGTMVELKGDYRIQLAAYKDREKSFISNLLAKLKWHGSAYSDRYFISKKIVWCELKKLGYLKCKSPFKGVPHFVFGLSTNLIAEFINGYFQGDGSYCKPHNTRRFWTSSKQLADDMFTLIYLTGHQVSLHARERISCSVINGRNITANYPEYSIYEYHSDQQSLDKKRDLKEIDYDGIVYCAEVEPFHTLVTRRNNTIMVSGNCVGKAANGIMSAYYRENLSSIYIYSLCKRFDGIPNSEGTYPRTAMKVLQEYGACTDETMPYSLLKQCNIPPQIPDKAYIEGKKRTLTTYARARTLTEVKEALSAGHLVMGVVGVGDNFMEYRGGTIGPIEGQNYGFHAVVFCGHSDLRQAVRGWNTWGEGWGEGGFFWLSYDAFSAQNNVIEAWIMEVKPVTPSKDRPCSLAITRLIQRWKSRKGR